jgi:hypothetical protein
MPVGSRLQVQTACVEAAPCKKHAWQYCDMPRHYACKANGPTKPLLLCPFPPAAVLLTTLLARMLPNVSLSRSRMDGRREGCVSQISRTKKITSSALLTCGEQRQQQQQQQECAGEGVEGGGGQDTSWRLGYVQGGWNLHTVCQCPPHTSFSPWARPESS